VVVLLIKSKILLVLKANYEKMYSVIIEKSYKNSNN
jgi:hypothetical protein